MTTDAKRAYWRKTRQRWRDSLDNRKKEAQRRDHMRESAATAKRKSTPEGWARAAIPRLRYRAKMTGLEFDIDWTDIVPPPVCPVLGLPLSLSGECSRLNWYSPSVDRIDNARGYVRGNVAVISNRANILKKDATPEELRRLLEYVS